MVAYGDRTVPNPSAALRSEMLERFRVTAEPPWVAQRLDRCHPWTVPGHFPPSRTEATVCVGRTKCGTAPADLLDSAQDERSAWVPPSDLGQTVSAYRSTLGGRSCHKSEEILEDCLDNPAICRRSWPCVTRTRERDRSRTGGGVGPTRGDGCAPKICCLIARRSCSSTRSSTIEPGESAQGPLAAHR